MAVRSSSNEELVDGVSLFYDAASNWFRVDLSNAPLVTNRYQIATLILFQRALAAQDGTVWDQYDYDGLWHRYGAWDLTYYLRGEQPMPDLGDSGDEQAEAIKLRTMALLEALHDEIEARLIQSIHLHDPLAPSAEAMFPYLLENAFTWFPRGTAFFNYPFNADALDAASAEATAAAEAYARGEPLWSFEALTDAYFWERYAAHGGLEQGARVLESILADRTFGLGTPVDVFDAIVARLNGRATQDHLCDVEGLFERVRVFADDVLAALPGDEFDRRPFDTLDDGFLVRVTQSTSQGAAQAADLSLIAVGTPDYVWGGMRVYREGERVLIYYAQEDGNPRYSIVRHVEIQGDEVICLPRWEYVELVAEFSD